MFGRMFTLNRRDFLKLFPTVLGSAMLACSKVEQRAGAAERPGWRTLDRALCGQVYTLCRF